MKIIYNYSYTIQKFVVFYRIVYYSTNRKTLGKGQDNDVIIISRYKSHSIKITYWNNYLRFIDYIITIYLVFDKDDL